MPVGAAGGPGESGIAFAAYNRYVATNNRPTAPELTTHVYPRNGHEGGDAARVRRQSHWLTSGIPPAG